MFTASSDDKHVSVGPDSFLAVMPLANRNLSDIIRNENLAGRDLDRIKLYMKQTLKRVGSMHQAGMIHGDVSPPLIYVSVLTSQSTL